MINELKFDSRFCNEQMVKDHLRKFILMAFTTQDLKDIMNCADKLQIENYCQKAAVDVLFEIAGKLSILEPEIVEPKDVMNKIREYLRTN